MTSLFNYQKINVSLVKKTNSLHIELKSSESPCESKLLIEELIAISNWASGFLEINAMVITNVGALDLAYESKFEDIEPALMMEIFSSLQELVYCFLYLPQTIIINYEDGASNLGIELGIGADIKIANPSAIFNFNYLKLGFTPGCGLLGVLCTQICQTTIRSWLLSSKKVKASELFSKCFLTDINETGDTLNEILSNIMKQSQVSRIQTKRSLLSHILPRLDQIKETEKSYNRSSLLTGDLQKLINHKKYEFKKAKEFSKIIKSETMV